MEFSGQYLTYEEYRALGGTLDLAPFNILEFGARRRIFKIIKNNKKRWNRRFNQIFRKYRLF